MMIRNAKHFGSYTATFISGKIQKQRFGPQSTGLCRVVARVSRGVENIAMFTKLTENCVVYTDKSWTFTHQSSTHCTNAQIDALHAYKHTYIRTYILRCR